jgi:hypothetical protein
LGFEILGVGVEYGESPILGVLILTAREDDLSKADLGVPIFRLKLDGALQFLNSRCPIAFALMTLRQLVMRIGKSRVDLESATEGDDGLWVFLTGEGAKALIVELLLSGHGTAEATGCNGCKYNREGQD